MIYRSLTKFIFLFLFSLYSSYKELYYKFEQRVHLTYLLALSVNSASIYNYTYSFVLKTKLIQIVPHCLRNTKEHYHVCDNFEDQLDIIHAKLYYRCFLFNFIIVPTLYFCTDLKETNTNYCVALFYFNISLNISPQLVS